jgi:hypothetical protein
VLIKGIDLNSRQRAEVLRAFPHRHTVENARRRGVACVMCTDSGGNREIVIPAGQQAAHEIRKRWHDHHVRVQTDQQWLIDRAFHFLANGSRLMHRRHAEPVYMAERVS